MSTTTATTRTASSKAAQTELFRNLVEDLDHNERQDLIIFLSKENKKNTTKTGRAKRAPKLDEDGNVIKKAISPGMAAWDAYVTYLKDTLQELYPEAKITRKMCLRLGSILKGKGAAADEGENCYYPEDNLTTETLQAEWDEWSALPAEEKFPPKEEKGKKKSKGSDSDSDSDSEPETEEPKAKATKVKKAAESESEGEKPKAKARGRPKKTSPLDEEEAAESSTESKASKKSKAKSVKAAEKDVEEEVKPKKASKKTAKAESDAEEEKPKKVKKGKKE
jgi:hypothetical protein